ncbi:hypothetical protein ACI2IY_19330 [Lysobacter enzymogenes]|uniref:hypothetical protein n=1 Tax=Lysobacter enzymogenes TaxID=69 RepID=UPI00384FACA5
MSTGGVDSGGASARLCGRGAARCSDRQGGAAFARWCAAATSGGALPAQASRALRPGARSPAAADRREAAPRKALKPIRAALGAGASAGAAWLAAGAAANADARRKVKEIHWSISRQTSCNAYAARLGARNRKTVRRLVHRGCGQLQRSGQQTYKSRQPPARRGGRRRGERLAPAGLRSIRAVAAAAPAGFRAPPACARLRVAAAAPLDRSA